MLFRSINLPLIKRRPGQEDVQVQLTPEQRCGDFINYTFRIVAKSMGRLDPQIRSKRIMEFGVNVLPAGIVAAQQMLQMGQQFNLTKFLTLMAEQLEISEMVEELFIDPDFERKMAIQMMLGPQNAGKGQIITPEGVAQQGGYPLAQNVASPQTEFNQQSQQTAAVGQSANQGVY